MVLIDINLIDDQVQILRVELVLLQNLVKDLDGGLGRAVDADDRVFPILGHLDLFAQRGNAVFNIRLHFVVGLVDDGLVLGAFRQVAYPLPLRDPQLLLKFFEDFFHVVCGEFFFLQVLVLLLNIGLELFDHLRRGLPDFSQIVLYHFIQGVHADVMAGAALEPPPVIGAASIGVPKVSPAHGEHGTAAVPAHEKTGIGVLVFFYAPVVALGSGFPQLLHDTKVAVADDRLMMVLDDDLLALVLFHILAVDLLAGIFALAQCADVKIIFEYALHGHDGPLRLDRALIFFALSLLAFPLRHTGRGDALVGQIIGDSFITPAVDVQLKDLADDLRFGRDDLKLLSGVDLVAVGRGTDPFAVLLAAAHHGADFLRGIGDRHLVHEKAQLDVQPLVIVGKVDPVPDGDDAHPGVAQVFQLSQAFAVTAGESGEILDHQNVVCVIEQPLAQLLIALALLKGVPGAVAVFKEGQAAAGEFFFDEVLDDRLLVFDRGVVPVQLFIDGDSAVTRNVKRLYHKSFLLSIFIC